MPNPTRSNPSSDTNNPWPRIDAWLEENAPAVRDLLAPPASERALREVAEALGQPLPPSLASAYRAHDGALNDCSAVLGAVRAPKGCEWVRYMSWLPLAKTLAQHALMRGISDEWPDDDLPVAGDAGGNLVVVSLGSQRVSLFDHETWELSPLAPDFSTWMRWLADDMEAGLVEFDEEESEYEDVLTLRAAPAKPAASASTTKAAASAPAALDDRPARVFLELLAERKLVTFVRSADPRKLLAALVPALAEKSAPARLRATLAVLEASEAVDEVYADDEELSELLEEFG